MSHPSCIMGDMNAQLRLIEDKESQWRLDDTTREAGRKGLAQARVALQQAARRAAA